MVLGADTRSTAGETVADKNCEKIHFMSPNIYCCGAGTAADTENVTGMISSQLELHRFRTGRESRVVTALTLLKSHLFRYQVGEKTIEMNSLFSLLSSLLSEQIKGPAVSSCGDLSLSVSFNLFQIKKERNENANRLFLSFFLSFFFVHGLLLLLLFSLLLNHDKK